MKYSNYCIWGTDQKIFFYYFNWCSSFFEWCVCGFFKNSKHWISLFLAGMNMARGANIIPDLPKLYWLCMRTIPKPENCLACISGLRCIRAHIILEVIFGTTSQNAIGWKSVWRRRSRTSENQKNRGKMPPGKLRCGGTRGPTRVDISTTRY